MDQALRTAGAPPAIGQAGRLSQYSLLFLDGEDQVSLTRVEAYSIEGVVRVVLQRLGGRSNLRFLGAVAARLEIAVSRTDLEDRAREKREIGSAQNIRESLRGAEELSDATHVVLGYYMRDLVLEATPVRVPPDVDLVDWCFHFVGHHMAYGQYVLLMVSRTLALPCLDYRSLVRFVSGDSGMAAALVGAQAVDQTRNRDLEEMVAEVGGTGDPDD